MARLYSNENFPRPVVEKLRALGHDDQALPDDEVLRFATENKRTLITLNRRHFIRLRGEHPNHEGIIVCKFDPDFEKQSQRIDKQINETGSLAG
jgi:hypothetical protein